MTVSSTLTPNPNHPSENPLISIAVTDMPYMCVCVYIYTRNHITQSRQSRGQYPRRRSCEIDTSLLCEGLVILLYPFTISHTWEVKLLTVHRRINNTHYRKRAGATKPIHEHLFQANYARNVPDKGQPLTDCWN